MLWLRAQYSFTFRISLLQMKPALAVAGLLAYPFAVGVEGLTL